MALLLLEFNAILETVRKDGLIAGSGWIRALQPDELLSKCTNNKHIGQPCVVPEFVTSVFLRERTWLIDNIMYTIHCISKRGPGVVLPVGIDLRKQV